VNVANYTTKFFNETKLASYFGRFQYKLMDRYRLLGQLDVMVSNFGKDYRWGTFQPLVLGWVVSKEDFIANVKGINLLNKRRLG
jgi:hypothetical protein